MTTLEITQPNTSSAPAHAGPAPKKQAPERQTVAKPAPVLVDRNFSTTVRIAMTVVCLGTLVLYVVGVHSPVRSLLALAFFAAAPGVAIVRHMPSLHSNARWAFAVALSLTINSTVPLIAVWTHTYKPLPILLVVVWPTIFGLWKTRSIK